MSERKQLDLSKLNRDVLQSTLLFLINDNQLTTDQVENALHEVVPNEFKRMCSTIHTLFCAAPHSDVQNSDTCEFYYEELLEECWYMPTHKLWLTKLFNLMCDLEIAGEDGLNSLLYRAREMNNRLLELREKDYNAYKLFMYMIGCEKFPG